MPYVSIRNLGMVGLLADRPNYDIPDNAFNIVENVRFFDGTGRKSSSPVERFSTNTDTLWMEIYLKEGVPTYTYATASAIYEIDPGTGVSSDVSQVGGYTSSEWQTMVWGNSVLYNDGGSIPQIKEVGDVLFKDLPNWPANLTAKVIRPFKNFMVALNVTDNADEKPTFVQWSNEAEPGEVPDSWVPTTTNLAGGNLLSSEDGEIIDGLELGDVFIIYTRQSAHEMSFIGGSLVMGFRKFTDNGLINRDAVCAFDTYHFCVGNASIYTHDGHSVSHIADQRVRDYFYGSITNTNSVRCVHLPESQECVIYFEADGSGTGHATKALIWCYRYDTWSFIDLPEIRRMQVSGFQPVPVTWEDLKNQGTTWDQITQTWAQLKDLSLTVRTYLLANSTDTLDDFDTVYGTGIPFRLERTGLDFDDTLGVPTNTVKFVNEILPQVKGSGNIQITMGWSDTPQGSVTWDAPVDYNIESDYKVDLRTSGRYPAWRFEGEDTGNFQLSGIDFNVVVDGER